MSPTVFALALAAASEGPPPAVGQEAQAAESPWSGSVALVSDYRALGVDATEGRPALQASLNYAAADRVNFGAFVSNIAETDGARSEIDVYASKSVTIGGTEISLGLYGFLFPDGHNLNVGTVFLDATRSVGPVDFDFVFFYAWPQASIGEDGVYAKLSASVPIKGTPFSVNAGLGYETGDFDDGRSDKKLDWSVGAAWALGGGVSLGASYVDNDLRGEDGEGGPVFSIKKTFS